MALQYPSSTLIQQPAVAVTVQQHQHQQPQWHQVPIESGLEVDQEGLGHKNEYIEHQKLFPQLVTYDASHPPSWSFIARSASAHTRRRQLSIAIIGMLIMISIVVGCTAGALLGTRRSQKKPYTTTPGNSAAFGLPSANAQMIRACSGIICSSSLSEVSLPGQRVLSGLASNKLILYLAGNATHWDDEWQNLGMTGLATPALVPADGGRVNVFAVSERDKLLYQAVINNGVWQGDWIKVGDGSLKWAGPLTALSPQKTVLLAYGLSPTGTLQEYWWFGVTSGKLRNLGGPPNSLPLVGTPYVASWDVNQKIVFARGADGALWYTQSGPEAEQSSTQKPFGEWTSLAGVLTSDPVVVVTGYQHLDVFALGPRGVLCWIGLRTNWLNWECMYDGRTFQSVPSAVNSSTKRVEVVALGSDDRVYHRSLEDTKWTPSWLDLGGPLNSAPTIYAYENQSVELTGVAFDSRVYASRWSTSGVAMEGVKNWTSLGGDFRTVN